VEGWLKSIVDRVGKAEAARLIGVSPTQVAKYWNHPPLRVQKRTATAILEVLQLLQTEDFALSRDAIRSGAVERGREAKRPETLAEFNGLRDPLNAVYKRNQRRRQRAVDPKTE
jgi:hypothetical protein